MRKNPQNAAEDHAIEIELTSISPVAYVLAREGDLAEINSKKPNLREYRSSIGAAMEVFLVFKGNTKIGMIPKDVAAKLGRASIGKKCRIVRMVKENNIIVIRLIRSSAN
jgi:hypothetical protein